MRQRPRNGASDSRLNFIFKNRVAAPSAHRREAALEIKVEVPERELVLQHESEPCFRIALVSQSSAVPARADIGFHVTGDEVVACNPEGDF